MIHDKFKSTHSAHAFKHDWHLENCVFHKHVAVDLRPLPSSLTKTDWGAFYLFAYILPHVKWYYKYINIAEHWKSLRFFFRCFQSDRLTSQLIYSKESKSDSSNTHTHAFIRTLDQVHVAKGKENETKKKQKRGKCYRTKINLSRT